MTKLSEAKEGDQLIVDSGFSCLKPGVHLVRSNENGLFLTCAMGEHYLRGQVEKWADGDGDLIGLRKLIPGD